MLNEEVKRLKEADEEDKNAIDTLEDDELSA